MDKKFGSSNWKDYIPQPICEEFPEYNEFYEKAWESAFRHIRYIPGMPQTPYMDEAFCDTLVWIWDTCFMSLFCKYAREAFPGVESLNNFYEVLHNGKRMPKIIASENEPKFTGATPGQAKEIRIQHADNPPLFAWAEYENALISGDTEYIKELLYKKQFLQKHYEWFESFKEFKRLSGVNMSTFLIAEELGYKWEGGSSGMDNTPRGRTTANAENPRPNNPDMLWIDAISQQALSARCISRLYKMVGDDANAEQWNEKFNIKKDIINGYYWDEEDKFYYDIDNVTHEFYKVKTIASFWTLTAGVATEETAKYMAEYISDPETFGGKVPLVSLARNDNDYCSNGRYWRGSLWLPTAYAALKGIADYGYLDEAHTAAYKIFKHMLNTYNSYEPHTIWECYAPEKSEPGVYDVCDDRTRPDFCGWSALGSISIYIEYVLGFHTVDAVNNIVKWNKPMIFKGEIGVKNLRFKNVITDITAKGNKCCVKTNAPYTLFINNREYKMTSGCNMFEI